MTIDQLLKMDMGSAIEWLTNNHDDFALVPRVPSQSMLFAIDGTELNAFCMSSRQSRQHDLGKQIYIAMIEKHEQLPQE